MNDGMTNQDFAAWILNDTAEHLQAEPKPLVVKCPNCGRWNAPDSESPRICWKCLAELK